jgi:DNA-binding transcriptional regulator WhiA
MIKQCEFCGAEYKTSPSRNQKFCSISCGLRARRVPDQHVFENYNEDSAYILGLIITDGCLSYSNHSQLYRIDIAMSEEDVMKKVHELMTPDKEFKSVSAKLSRRPMFMVTSYNKQDIEFLRRVGVEERKSYTVRFPHDMEYERDLIRGIFDGDGSVFINKVKGHKYLHVSITTASEGFANDLVEIFGKYGIDSSIVIDSRSKDKENKTYYVKIYSKENIKKFYDLLYSHNPRIYSSRKKRIFDNMI